MAHKSKKKHIKHVHQHEVAAPPTKRHPGAKAAREVERLATPAATKTGRAKGGNIDLVGVKRGRTTKKRGIVRSIARATTKKLAAKPKRVIAHAKSRVRTFLNR